MGRKVDRDLVQALVVVYRSHAPRIGLLPDARACLDGLAGRVALAAVTDGPLESQRAKARALDLERWLRPIVFTADLGAGFGKPSPQAFRAVESAHRVAGPSCVYVADNPAKDFQGPASLGWRTVRVVREGGLHVAAPSGSEVQIEMKDLAALPEALGIAP
jgi:putative hydrolase of the HAD superfamily